MTVIAPAAPSATSRAAAPPVHRAPPDGAGGLAPRSATVTLLAAEHFAAAMLFLVAGALTLPWVAPQLALGLYPDERVAGVAHLFTLGWLTTAIFGALHQLLPVALGAPIGSARAGHVAFWSYAPGVALFATGVMRGDTRLHHAGIALVATGVLIAIVNFGIALRRAAHRDATWAAVAVALTALAATFALGVMLLHNLHTGWLGGLRTRFVAIHLHVALVGWALTMMVGMSHRLLPMFLLAHGVDTRWTRRALVLLTASLPPLVAGLASGVQLLQCTGIAIGAAGVACFLCQARLFFRRRLRRSLDAGMRHAAVALGFLAVATALAPAVHVLGADVPGFGARLAVAYVVLGLLGGVIIYVAGFAQKIIPFLAWIARYQDRVGREAVPTVAELTSQGVAHAQLVLLAAGVAVTATGVLLGHAGTTRGGTLLFAAGVLLLVAQMARVGWCAVRA